MTVDGPSPHIPPPRHAGNAQTDKVSFSRLPTPRKPPSTTDLPAPEGVSTELWNMLNERERAFFLEHLETAMTYGPRTPRGAAAEAPRGGRIDARA